MRHFQHSRHDFLLNRQSICMHANLSLCARRYTSQVVDVYENSADLNISCLEMHKAKPTLKGERAHNEAHKHHGEGSTRFHSRGRDL